MRRNFPTNFSSARRTDMKLEKIVIKDFKRFTHLTIESIPETARLIMLFGPNGCGKSSLFDALYL